MEHERTVADTGVSDREATAAAERRRRAAVAGHEGDEDGARRLLHDPEPDVRATALRALARMGKVADAEVATALHDASPLVRRRALAVAVDHPDVPVAHLLDDADEGVVEQAAWALGERGPAGPEVVRSLCAVATEHPDALCREAAVAALGAIGDEAALPAVLRATRDKATVRRRAVLALAPFEGPEVDEALARAREDRDWQVRQAAEDLLGE